MKSKFSALLASAAIATGVMVSATAPAKAALLACTGSNFNIADNVTNTSGCQRSDTLTQDDLNPSPIVNTENFFGFANWTFGGKIGVNEDGFNLSNAGTGSGQSGTWNLSSIIQNTWTDTMLIFKSGQGTFLTGYKVASGATSGNWTSPFEEPPFNFPGTGPKNVSHISVYYRQGTTPVTPVPEPASLLGLGLVASGMVMARRRQAAANN